eukprot:CAMPEP_0118869398 /NCGR_PEP_ID=MMETSP1163-20130328/12751_1 /TAXON_ID=124430 /ORGANISM="Phaeomonas parva, Strain CCMP2877" /LENGTH=54 /DNA_ID=CAMNT_0006804287 /DNA_START=8 /DNA_END=168 /DNA_ORIENTATION=+
MIPGLEPMQNYVDFVKAAPAGEAPASPEVYVERYAAYKREYVRRMRGALAAELA